MRQIAYVALVLMAGMGPSQASQFRSGTVWWGYDAWASDNLIEQFAASTAIAAEARAAILGARIALLRMQRRAL